MSVSPESVSAPFPLPLDQYPGADGAALLDLIAARAEFYPFNIAATAIFLLAVTHTFFAKRFVTWSHHVQARHDAARRAAGLAPRLSFPAEVLHFLGEIEVVFGLWVVAVLAAITASFDWDTAVHYLSDQVNFTEPMFVVVIMAIAASHPIVSFAQDALRRVAALGDGTPAAWWVTILTVGPLLGSLITEPAAMTISAVLLGRQFYACRPSTRLRYATLGLLFCNISIGGTLTHFAAPPVLMVARTWDWSLGFMAANFGWKACVAIGVANLTYYLVFRQELDSLAANRDLAVHEQVAAAPATEDVPAWVVLAHMAALAWTVAFAHYPVLFVGGFLFFLGFAATTAPYQTPIDLKPPMLVGFFLAGLVIHGGLQGWWIAPTLGALTDVPLFAGAVMLTAFNDNALITYLATLVPDLNEALKYAIVAGAVTGGGLTVIANAPNPAGQALLSRYFDGGISPPGLLAGALVPTFISAACYLLL
ncbi:MAG: putative Na+/H+ antiporter [Vicinamibacterales bacterium]|nr:putative Na+/H+ antiporter [Vicinamibacterales bacterium]